MILFPGSGLNGADCSATDDGYTRTWTYPFSLLNDYSDTVPGSGATVIGWVSALRAPTPLCSGALSCLGSSLFLKLK